MRKDGAMHPLREDVTLSTWQTCAGRLSLTRLRRISPFRAPLSGHGRGMVGTIRSQPSTCRHLRELTSSPGSLPATAVWILAACLTTHNMPRSALITLRISIPGQSCSVGIQVFKHTPWIPTACHDLAWDVGAGEGAPTIGH